MDQALRERRAVSQVIPVLRRASTIRNAFRTLVHQGQALLHQGQRLPRQLMLAQLPRLPLDRYLIRQLKQAQQQPQPIPKLHILLLLLLLAVLGH